jgi:hypothetical protein
MKARQKALANHALVVVLAPRLTLHKAIADFLQTTETKKRIGNINWRPSATGTVGKRIRPS